MTTDAVGGKKLSAHDKKLLTKLATCHSITAKQALPTLPVRFELTEKGREAALATQVDESDVQRLATLGWIELVKGEPRFEITAKGIEALKTGVARKPISQDRLL